MAAERAWKEDPMEIKVGDIFEKFSNEMDFTVLKIVDNWVILESPDKKKQILAGLNNLKANSFHLKEENRVF